jgi:hypothetical protein
MQKTIVNQFGQLYLVPTEHAAKFNRRSELVMFAQDLQKAIDEVSDPTNLKKHLSKTMQQIRGLNRRIPPACAEFIGGAK